MPTATRENKLPLTHRFTADLIVTGGYGHSRLREWILGGVTRHLINQPGIPLLIGAVKNLDAENDQEIQRRPFPCWSTANRLGEMRHDAEEIRVADGASSQLHTVTSSILIAPISW